MNKYSIILKSLVARSSKLFSLISFRGFFAQPIAFQPGTFQNVPIRNLPKIVSFKFLCFLFRQNQQLTRDPSQGAPHNFILTYSQVVWI